MRNVAFPDFDDATIRTNRPDRRAGSSYLSSIHVGA